MPRGKDVSLGMILLEMNVRPQAEVPFHCSSHVCKNRFKVQLTERDVREEVESSDRLTVES